MATPLCQDGKDGKLATTRTELSYVTGSSIVYSMYVTSTQDTCRCKIYDSRLHIYVYYSIVISTVQTRSFVLLHLKSAASFGFRFAAPWEEWQHPWMLYRLNGEGQPLASTSGVCCWLLLPATSSGMTRAKGLVSNAFHAWV